MNVNYECKLCNYSTANKYHFTRHCTSNKIHINNEKINKHCGLCNKNYDSIQNYKYHKYNCHKRKDKINNTDDNLKKSLTKIKKHKNINIPEVEIIKKNQEEIIDEIKDVKLVVNNAISKASNLIKYLVEHRQDTPPLKKINYNQCLDRLRLDFDCPENADNEYLLEKKLIQQYNNGIFIENLCKSILNLIKNRTNNQSVYNTDSTRYNYVVKITDTNWNEDVAGKRFCKLIIKPLLNSIENLISSYRENFIEKTKIKNNQCFEYLENLKNIVYFEKDLFSDKFIKPILKEISPNLRFISKELENLEKLEEIEQFQKDILDIVKNNSDSESNSESETY
jgi:hypothetical protein